MSPEAWGIAGIIVTVIVGIPAYFATKRARSKKQTQKVNNGGVAFQAGRDNNVDIDQ